MSTRQKIFAAIADGKNTSRAIASACLMESRNVTSALNNARSRGLVEVVGTVKLEQDPWQGKSFIKQTANVWALTAKGREVLE